MKTSEALELRICHPIAVKGCPLTTTLERLCRDMSGCGACFLKVFAAAIPYLGARSAGLESQHLTPQESTALTLKNYAVLKDDLQLLNKLMHIARNMLVTPEPEVAQDLCAAVQMDQMVYEMINLCTDMTGKAYEGDLDDNSRIKLNEITELCKTSLRPLQPQSSYLSVFLTD